MNTLQDRVKPYAKAVVRLLKGDVESNDKQWETIVTYQIEIENYINQIGLELIINKEDGYAFLKQFDLDEEGSTIGLVIRRPMSFDASVVLVIIRQILEDFESNPTQIYVNECYVTHVEIKDYVEIFLADQNNRSKFLKNMDHAIKKIVDLGYLKIMNEGSHLNNRKYRVKKVIKEKVTLDVLSDFKEKLDAYVQSI